MKQIRFVFKGLKRDIQRGFRVKLMNEYLSRISLLFCDIKFLARTDLMPLRFSKVRVMLTYSAENILSFILSQCKSTARSLKI
jgi:hypothetical protein